MTCRVKEVMFDITDPILDKVLFNGHVKWECFELHILYIQYTLCI